MIKNPEDIIIDCIIPARGGSKGVPRKNVKILSGHPLLTYSIATSKLSKYIRNTIVTTDCQEIANIALEYGADVPYLRPAEISGDNATDLEFFKYHIQYLREKNLEIPDLLIHLRPTTPLRETDIINDAINSFLQDEEATALRSVIYTHLTPYKIFKKVGNYMKPFLKSDLAKEFYNLPRQAFEDAYIPNGYIDVVRTDIFADTDILHGDNIYMYITDNVADIDTIEEFHFAEEIVHQQRFSDILEYLKRVKDNQ